METTSERVTRQSHTSFDYAFRILPAEKRHAIHALYSFCRVVDDCADEVGGEGAAGLDRWLEELEHCYAREPATDIGRDLTLALARFPIPRSCLEEVVAGCRMDLTTTRYATFEELTLYCRRVASAVGLATIEIFGYTNPRTRDYAVELGLALQLTNILRDVGSDAVHGRIYLPLEDLSRFGVREDALPAAAKGDGAHPPGLDPLLSFEAGRAREHYGRARTLLPAEDRKAMVSAEVMGGIYRALLEKVVAERFPLDRRVSLSKARKAWIALRTVVGMVFA